MTNMLYTIGRSITFNKQYYNVSSKLDIIDNYQVPSLNPVKANFKKAFTNLCIVGK